MRSHPRVLTAYQRAALAAARLADLAQARGDTTAVLHYRLAAAMYGTRALELELQDALELVSWGAQAGAA